MAFALLVAACDGAAADPATADTCGQLINVAVASVNALGSDADEATGEEYAALLGDLRTDMAAIADRADALACDAGSTSHGFRRSLLGVNHEIARRSVLVLEAAMFDPFRGHPPVSLQGTVSLAGDVDAGLDRLEELTTTLVTDYRNGGADPIDRIDISTEFSVAVTATWVVDDESRFDGAAEDLALLLLVDQGFFAAREIPVGIAARQAWLDETVVEGATVDELQTRVWGALSKAFSHAAG